MTDAKLDARLAKLSDEDLQAIAAGTWPSQIAYHFDSPKFLDRMAREILDLRMQLGARYCEDIAYLEGGDDGFATAVRQVADILDGNDSGKGSSSCEPWESVRRRLLTLVPPADDAMPVTRDWIATISGEVLRDDDALAVRVSKETVIFWSLASEFPPYTEYCTVAWNRHHTHQMKTRGDVRRFVKALGIEMKEQPCQPA